MNHKQALEMALKNDEGATCYDFKDTIEVVHQDGSHLTYESAIFEWLDKTWFAVRTEHCGVQVFHSGDVSWVSKITRKRLYTNKEP